ncbi:hypothetical protein C5167_032192 [Papaver somniferum]|uniref:Uncharacterized protein n=1 Tax=Papaver somniferum TaxID=3469 RepID=A0A4Y7K8G8_PAPSO|nr:hypothetical protein C5167_032192 [Papaver somniferum]
MSNHGRSIVLYSCPKSSTFEFFVFLPYILKCGTRRFHFVSHADVHHDFDLWFSSQLNKNFKTQVSSQILRYYKTQITGVVYINDIADDYFTDCFKG